MVELQIPRHLGPESAPEWFAIWAPVADEPQLTLIVPAAASGGRAEALENPAFQVLVAASVASRSARALRTDLGPGAVPAALTAAFLAPAHEQSQIHARGGGSDVLRRVTDLRVARELADRSADVLESQMPSLSASVVRMARFVFEELAANIVQHSGAAQTGFGCVRARPELRRLELAFADCGVGFRESLQRNLELRGRVADDAEALQLALSPRISGTGPGRTNMGWGLKQLIDFSDLLGGDLWIATGEALFHRKTAAGQRVNTIRAMPPWRGTWICLDAPVS